MRLRVGVPKGCTKQRPLTSRTRLFADIAFTKTKELV